MEGREVGREGGSVWRGGRWGGRWCVEGIEGGGVWRGSREVVCGGDRGRWCVEGIEGGGVWRGSREVVCGGEGGVEGREVCLKRISVL